MWPSVLYRAADVDAAARSVYPEQVPRFDATSAECIVLTYKEGLLSAVAHDLEIRVSRFEIEIDDTTHAIRASFDPTSLRVVTAMQDGAPRAGALSDGDKQKIEQNIIDDVLQVKKHREVRLSSNEVTHEGDGYRVRASLTLHGETRPVTFTAREKGDRLVAEVQVHQPDFGIKPYSAMLGTLKVKPALTVRCSVPRASVSG